MNEWSENEILFLKNNYGKMLTKDISKEINRSVNAIRTKAQELKIKTRGSNIVWTNEMLKLIENEYFNLGPRVISDKLQLNYDTVIHKAKKMKIKNRIPFEWNQEMDNFLIEHYPKGHWNEIKKFFGNLSKKIIKDRASYLNLKADFFWWSNNDLELLKKLYPHYTNKYLQKNYFPNRKMENIRNMGAKLGLNKTKEKGCKWYNAEEMLKLLKEISEKLGRTPLGKELVSNGLPSQKSYERYFGGYMDACEIVGISPNISSYGRPNINLVSKNGDICLSYCEVFITNFFIENQIEYEKEKKYKNLFGISEFGEKRTDWYLSSNNTVVEYFGMMGIDDYEKGVLEKLSLCDKYGIKIIPIYPKQLSLNFLKNTFLKQQLFNL